MGRNQNLLIDKILLNFRRLMNERQYVNMYGFSAYVKKPEKYLHRYRKIGTLLEIARKYHKKGDVILDVGCGAGVPLVVSTHIFGNVTGFDLNRTAMNILGKYIHFHRINAGNLLGSITNIPIETMCADIVWCLDVLEHLVDPKQAILEIKRILKPNGYLIVSLPSENYLMRVLKKMMNRGAKGHYIGNVRSFSRLFEMLSKHFYLVETQTIPRGLPSTLAYSVFAAFMNQKSEAVRV